MALPPLFLSYARDNLPHAQAIHDRLTAAGVGVWFDKVGPAPGFQWHRKIEAAFKVARIVLPVLSPRWKKSEWARYATDGAENVIPLAVEGDFVDVSIPPRVRHQNAAIPLAGEGEETWQQLFASIRNPLGQPVPTAEDRSCVEGASKVLRPYHPQTRTVRSNLAALLGKRGGG